MKNELIHMGNMRGGKWEKTFEESRQFYSADGISPTVTAKGGGNQEIKIGELMPRLVGGVGEKKSNNGTQFYQQDRIYSSDTVAMAHPAQIPGGSYMYAVEEEIEVFEKQVRIAASRGRDPENPSCRERERTESVSTLGIGRGRYGKHSDDSSKGQSVRRDRCESPPPYSERVLPPYGVL